MLCRQTVFYPSDVALMQRVFVAHCAEFGCLPGSFVAKQVADAVITLFKMGYTNEASLDDALAGRANAKLSKRMSSVQSAIHPLRH